MLRPGHRAVALLSFAIAGCSSSYHPEYHPVTVSNFSQNIAYPAPSTVDASQGLRPPVIIAAPPSAIVLPSTLAQEPGPPPDFFR